jgi:polysaccharide biosynthesis protein PslG
LALRAASSQRGGVAGENGGIVSAAVNENWIRLYMRNVNRLICVSILVVAFAAAEHWFGTFMSTTVAPQTAAAIEAQLQPNFTPEHQLKGPDHPKRKGINAGDLRGLSASALSAAVNDLVAPGVSWVRMDFPWSEIEIAQGAYNTKGADAAVRALAIRGIQVLGIIDYAPPWANGGRGQMYPPASPTDFAIYAAFLVRHFAPLGVHSWEIWNEPNLQVYWVTGADPARYTQLLKAAYVAIKATDAGATVVTGGLAPAASSGGDLTPMDFLTGIYNNGGQGYFDAVADHPYTYPFMPDDRNGGAYWWQAMNDLHAIMTVHGDSSKLIWMTEYGAPTNGPPAARFVSESNQAVMLTKSYTMIETYEWAGPLFWYALHDGGTSTTTLENFFGILRFNGSHKPAYSALQRIAPR